MKIFKRKRRLAISISVFSIILLIIVSLLSGKDEGIHLTYKSQEGYVKMMAMYERFLKTMSSPYQEIDIKTSWGITHVIKTGAKNKKPLVILHGGGSNAAIISLFIKPFIKDYTIYSIDFMGEPGKSVPIRIPIEERDLADWLNEVFVGLRIDRADIIGFSWGAYTGQRFLKYYSHKVNKLAACLNTYLKGDEGFSISTLGQLIYYNMFPTQNNTKKFLVKLHSGPIMNKEAYKLLLDHFNGMAKYCRSVPYKMGGTSLSSIKKIQKPVLIVIGEKDCFFDAQRGKKYLQRAKNPNIQMKIIKDMGHLVVDDIYNVLVIISDFLK